MRESSKKTTDAAAAKASKAKVAAKAVDKNKAASSQKAAAKKATTTAQRGAKKPRSRAVKKSSITPEERWKMISEAAYYIAEKRGFQNSTPEEDWFQAEAQVDAILMSPENKLNAT